MVLSRTIYILQVLWLVIYDAALFAARTVDNINYFFFGGTVPKHNYILFYGFIIVMILWIPLLKLIVG